MGQIQAGNRLRVTAVMMYMGVSVVENVYDIVITGPGDGDDDHILSDLANWLDDCYTQLNSSVSTGLTYTEIRFFNTSRNMPLPPKQWPTLTAGGASGDGLPPGVSGVVTFRTYSASVVGRKFCPPFGESKQAGGELLVAPMGDMALFAAGLMSAPPMTLSGGFAAWMIIDKDNVAWFPISYVVRSALGYQRRRKQYVGV
jgi:hypothetical protein